MRKIEPKEIKDEEKMMNGIRLCGIQSSQKRSLLFGKVAENLRIMSAVL